MPWKKFDLLSILTKDTQNDPPNFVDVKLLNGAAVVHFLCTMNAETFDQYADQVFPSICHEAIGKLQKS